jgi:hypothetical protein
MLLTVSVTGLRVTRGKRVELAERLEIVQRELIAREVKGDVLKSTAIGDQLSYMTRTNKQALTRDWR